MSSHKFFMGRVSLLAVALVVGLASNGAWAQTSVAPAATTGTSALSTSVANGASSPAAVVSATSGSGSGSGKTTLPGLPIPALANPAAPSDTAATAKPTDGSQPLAAEAQRNTEADEVEFQRFVQQSTGQRLRLYGYELFGNKNSFEAVQSATVPAGYVLGPGDEIALQAYGLFDLAERFTIDREGRINLPKAGPLTLAGVPYSDAEKVITAHLARVYKNFNISVTMGRLRSIEVFVVGQARRPGKHVVNSLSSLVNALFETGGPGANGSMRAVELRRAGKTVAVVDMYRFLSLGDSTGDARLLNGDVIYIPPAGPRAAVLGTINAPAIYELKAQESIQDVLSLSGGLPVLAAPQKAQLERVNPNENIARYVQDFALDSQGLAYKLQAGDVLTVFQISPQIANVVTLEGNVAAPMRYTFVPGMKVSDLLSESRLLIPGSYWLQLNQGSSASTSSRPEVNLDYATIQRLDPLTLRTRLIAFNLGKAIAKNSAEDLKLLSGDILTVYKPGQAGPTTENSVTVKGEIVGGVKNFVWRPGFTIKDIIPSAQWLVDYYNYWQRPSGANLKNDINWDYAQIIRRNAVTLETRALTFNLGDAVLRNQAAANVSLEPGDEINLYTTSQLAVPSAKRTQVVTVSGEVAVPGSYQLQPGETLPQLIRRVGGLTPQAYVFGTDLSRESVRKRQQENLDTLIRRLEAQSQSQSAAITANMSADRAAQAQALQQQQQAQLKSQVERLKALKSNGRLALELDPAAANLAALPALPLEDGDRILVPATPGFVSAFGSVNNENVFIHKPGKTVADIIKSAGLTEDAEPDQAFVLRADGSIVARRDRSGFFGGSFESLQVMPGDTVVVPAQLDRETRYNFVTRVVKDWTQILSNFGLGAAAIKTLNN